MFLSGATGEAFYTRLVSIKRRLISVLRARFKSRLNLFPAAIYVQD